jgi:hypothetical protein
MNAEPLAATQANRRARMLLESCIAMAALTSLLLAPAAQAAGAGESGSGAKSHAVSFESIAGTKAKRIILTEKAAQRLGIETGKVDEGVIVRKQVVGGVFVTPSVVSPALTAAASFAPAAASGASDSSFSAAALQRSALTPPAIGDGLVRVMFSPQEWDRLAKGQPARVFKLAPRSDRSDGMIAKPSGIPAAEDSKRSMLVYFYVLDGKEHGLVPNERVRVELPLADTGEKRKVVPYSAVYYDAKGDAWVYLNPKPLVYERKAIRIEHVIGDKAALIEGPDVGAAVVTVGAALLYGTELYGK